MKEDNKIIKERLIIKKIIIIPSNKEFVPIQKLQQQREDIIKIAEGMKQDTKHFWTEVGAHTFCKKCGITDPFDEDDDWDEKNPCNSIYNQALQDLITKIKESK